MTYHCGIGEGMRSIGLTPCEPHFTCDICGIMHGVTTEHGGPCMWFQAGKAPPGWMQQGEASEQKHYCRRCLDRSVTVCAECLRATCWQGKFYCQEKKIANTKKMPIRELMKLKLENPCYWTTECERGER